MNIPYDVHVRAEQKTDYASVQVVNEATFETPAEARLVNELREQAQPIISLVAERSGAIIGHIAFSPVVLIGDTDRKMMGLAPMAVAHEHQRQGIGTGLVYAGLEECRKLHIGGVVVLGHPEYYPRFGFRPAAASGIGCEYDVPEEAFMLLELEPGYLHGASGTIRYHPVFAGL